MAGDCPGNGLSLAAREKGEVLAAFAAHKKEVPSGYVAEPQVKGPKVPPRRIGSRRAERK